MGYKVAARRLQMDLTLKGNLHVIPKELKGDRTGTSLGLKSNSQGTKKGLKRVSNVV